MNCPVTNENAVNDRSEQILLNLPPHFAPAAIFPQPLTRNDLNWIRFFFSLTLFSLAADNQPIIQFLNNAAQPPTDAFRLRRRSRNYFRTGITGC